MDKWPLAALEWIVAVLVCIIVIGGFTLAILVIGKVVAYLFFYVFNLF